MITLLHLILTLAATAPASPTPLNLTIDGVARQAIVYYPAEESSRPAPLVFAFHGHGGTMQAAARQFRIQELWPEAVVVYMQGLPTPGRLLDPKGLRSGWQSRPGDQGDRDLRFFDAVLAAVKAKHAIDPARIFATGHSNGGGFTYLLWGTRPDVFAAFAPASAAAGGAFPDLKPKPALVIAGEKDPLVKFEWQQAFIASIRKLNQCQEEGKPWADECTIYESKSKTPLVAFIHPGGHAMPKETGKLIVKFFKECTHAGD